MSEAKRSQPDLVDPRGATQPEPRTSQANGEPGWLKRNFAPNDTAEAVVAIAVPLGYVAAKGAIAAYNAVDEALEARYRKRAEGK